MQMRKTDRERGYSKLQMKKKKVPLNLVNMVLTVLSLNDHETRNRIDALRGEAV